MPAGSPHGHNCWSSCKPHLTLGHPIDVRLRRMSGPQPGVTPFAHKLVVVQLRICEVNAVDLLSLAQTERLLWVEAPDSFKEPLPAKHFVQPGNAAGKLIRG